MSKYPLNNVVTACHCLMVLGTEKPAGSIRRFLFGSALHTAISCENHSGEISRRIYRFAGTVSSGVHPIINSLYTGTHLPNCV